MVLKKTYVSRALHDVLRQRLSQYKVVVLSGPRQSGKSTLLQQQFRDEFAYVSLDDLSVRRQAENDPKGFLLDHPSPLIIDEVQHVPDLFSYIKLEVDSHPEKTGQYLLTGSENLLLSERVSESLAGRASILNLYPFTMGELAGNTDRELPWDRNRIDSVPAQTFGVEELWRGLYPQPALREIDADLWQGEYVRTYVERDVRSLRNIADLGQFQLFMRLLAERNAGMLNYAALSNDVGASANTVKQWVSVLEATFQVFTLPPYYRNAGKRLRKTNKLYFMDTGTLAWLQGLNDPALLQNELHKGRFMETWVILEIIKTLAHQGKRIHFYFWRTEHGAEVDLVLDYGRELIPVEIKAGSTVHGDWKRHLESFMQDYPSATRGYVIYGGETVMTLGKNITAIPVTLL